MAEHAQDPSVAAWLDALAGSLLPWERAALDEPAELVEAFGTSLHFGTGGIRARMGVGPGRFNRLTVAQAAAGLAAHLREAVDRTPMVVVAHDSREHSREFAEAACGALAAAGCRALLFDRSVPTPALSFAVRELGADAGVVITASHNPREDNGFKAYGPTGCQATDALCRAVAARMDALVPLDIPVKGFNEGLADGSIGYVPDEVLDSYLDAVLAQRVGVDCGGLRVVYTPLNGTGFELATRALEDLGVGFSLVGAQAAPDGTFPTCPRPNPELPEALALGTEQMLAEGAALLLATDPDADRLGVVVNHVGDAVRLTGDEVGLLLFDWFCEAAPVPEGAVAYSTVVGTPLADEVAAAHGVTLRRTLTGFKYIGEQLDRLEAQGEAGRFLLGFEESLGYLRGIQTRDKDGVLALALVCELAAWHAARGRDLAEALGELHVRYGFEASRQLSVVLPGAEGREAIGAFMRGLREEPPAVVGGLAVESVTDFLAGAPMPGDPTQALPPADVVQFDLKGGSRFLARPSGTEPKLKLYLFARGASQGEAGARLGAMEADVRARLPREGGRRP